VEAAPWLADSMVRQLRADFGTPLYVYDQRSLLAQAQQALAFPAPFGLTVRYAMKACPSAAVVRALVGAGLHIDASSGHEAWRALRAGVTPTSIQLTTQELPADLEALLATGVLFNASSLRQLEAYGRIRPGTSASFRVNPGLGSGHSNRTNVGGPAASFGVWHEHLDQARGIAARFGLTITGLHSHIGSGTDPEVWHRCARLTLTIASLLPDVVRVSLGGGFKVGRMPGELSTDLQRIGTPIAAELERFARDHGRRLHLEIEPGTFVAANAGALVCTVTDIVDTGPAGYRFIKTDSGMTEILRPSLYGAQHPLRLVRAAASPPASQELATYVVVGHCCESGDVLTPAPGNPEALGPRSLPVAHVGDLLVIGGSGAYCAAMPAKNYNSFPEAAEAMLDQAGTPHLIRRRQTLEQMLANEILPPFLR